MVFWNVKRFSESWRTPLYKQNEDTHLDVHTDDSDVTFNVCLGREFEGAGLVICGLSGKADHRLHRHLNWKQTLCLHKHIENKYNLLCLRTHILCLVNTDFVFN